MIKKILSLFKQEGNEDLFVPKDVNVTFHLNYKELPIGTLTVDKAIWTFKYTDEFRGQHDIQPLMDFPDVDKVYVSKDLWPFFVYRIPGLNQYKVQEIIRLEHLDGKNEVDLLRRFGQRSINNPFQLTAG